MEFATSTPLSQREINNLLDNAETLANETLGHPKSENTVEVHHHHHNSCWWAPFFWPSHHTTIINGDSRTERERQHDNSNATRLLVGISMSIVALATSYFIGKDFGRLGDTADELDRVEQEVWALDGIRQTPKTRKVYKILHDEERLLKAKKTDTLVGLALKVSLIASATLGVAGAVCAAPALMIGGAVGGVAVGASMLVKAGYNHASHRWERQAQRILREVDEARQIASC